MLIANTLVKLACPDDEILLKASIDSVTDACDLILILSCQGKESLSVIREIIGKNPKVRISAMEDGFIEKHGFAVARNILLDMTPAGEHVLYLDSDEVHFPDQLKILKDNCLEEFDDISTHFIHFCIGTNYYEKFERRVSIFKKYEGTHWVNKVHEKIVHVFENRKLFNSDLIYHHYGYCRDQQSIIYERWRSYALLEGQKTPSVEQEYPDKRVLDHRRDSLLPYFGAYPKDIPKEWIISKFINL